MVKREEETTKNSLTKNECLINTVSHLRVSTVQEWTQSQMNPEAGCRQQACGERAGSDRCCLGVRMARIHFPKPLLALIMWLFWGMSFMEGQRESENARCLRDNCCLWSLLKGFVVVSVDSFSDQFLKI